MAKINKMIIGLIVLVAGIITIIVLPGWGKWLTDYPATVASGAAAYIGSLPSAVSGLSHGFPGRAQCMSSSRSLLRPAIGSRWPDMAGEPSWRLSASSSCLGGMMKSEK